MTAPADLHQFLERLAPRGWAQSNVGSGLYLEPSLGGPIWIRDDLPGRVVMYGSGMLMRGPSLLVPLEMGEVEEFVKERVRT